MKVNVLIRTDASQSIGIGHVMRCLTLAKALRKQSARVVFACSPLLGNNIPLLEHAGFTVYRLPCYRNTLDWRADARRLARIARYSTVWFDWVIVDHYQLDYRWEQEARMFCSRLMVIDDLANRKHACSVLLDQNFVANYKHRYKGLLLERCESFLGPRFVLLRNEFLNQRTLLARNSTAHTNILVSFGGSDPTNETAKTLQALERVDRTNLLVSVVVGGTNPYRTQINKMCRGMKGVQFHCQVNDMARLMSKADLAIGSGGTTTWERCFLGVPAIVISQASNQDLIAAYGAEKGLFVYLGKSKQVTVQHIADAITRFLGRPRAGAVMKRKMLSLGIASKTPELIERIMKK